MRYAPVLLTLLVSGCAMNGVDKPLEGLRKQPGCISQDRCLLGCIVKDNQCSREEKKPDGAQ